MRPTQTRFLPLEEKRDQPKYCFTIEAPFQTIADQA